MKLIIVSLTLALAATPVTLGRSNKEAPGNARCSLTRDQAPGIRGFRLGTSSQQVLARFPGLIIESTGESTLELVFVKGESDSLNRKDVAQSRNNSVVYVNRDKFTDFKGYSGLYLQFSEGSITLIKASYDDTIKWNTIDEFVATVSQVLGLPSRWQTVLFTDHTKIYVRNKSDGSYGKRLLECVGFRAIAEVPHKCEPPFCGPPDEPEPRVTLSLEATTVPLTRDQLQKQRKEEGRREEEKRKIFKP